MAALNLKESIELQRRTHVYLHKDYRLVYTRMQQVLLFDKLCDSVPADAGVEYTIRYYGGMD